MGTKAKVIACAALVCAACGGDSGSSADAGPAMICNLPLDGGIGCGVRPTATDDQMSDGFGYHAIGVPDSMTPDTPIFVFLEGTLGVPFMGDSETYSDVAPIVLQEGLDHGYLVLDIAYSRFPSPDAQCGTGASLECWGQIRQADVAGSDDPASPKQLAPPDDILSRVDALVAYLHGTDPARYPAQVNWATTVVGGHSQGGGHAAFLAKELHGVARICNFSGLGDSDPSGTAASWVTDGVFATQLANMRFVVHVDDTFYAMESQTWQTLGLALGTGYEELTTQTTDPHDFPMSDDPEAVAAREWACFE
jgi:hypothetical protein